MLPSMINIQKRLERKLHDVIYPSRTPVLDEKNSTYLGTTRLQDVPANVDEFFRLWFLAFNRFTSWFFWFRLLVEGLLKNYRFVSFSEYQEVFKDKTVGDGSAIQSRYPIYRLLGIHSEHQKQRFVNTFPNNLKGYFQLMKGRNKDLWELFCQQYHVRFPNDLKPKHTYIVGGSGSGKSELLKHLLLQDVGKGESCVILIEPNGDVSEQIARNKLVAPNRLVYVDCSSLGRTPHINPFELMRVDETLEVEKQNQVIRGALQQIFEADGQPLTLQMQSVIEPCLHIVATQKGTLKDLQRFMVDGLNDDLVEAGKQSSKYKDFFERKFKESNLQPSRQGIYQKLMLVLNMTTFSDFFCGQTSIDLQRAIRDKKIIIFNLSKGKLGDLASAYIGKMMVAIIQNLIFQRASVKESERTPVAIYIDEFQDFINESAEQLFVQSRKYNVSLTVASQIIGQRMTAEMTKIVLGNTSVKFIGQNGYNTLSVMSRETFTEIEELKTLSVGRFFCRMGDGQGFVLQVPDKHLKWKNCRDEKEWKAMFADQVNRFYKVRQRAHQSPTTLNPPNKLENLQKGKFKPKY